MQQHKLPVEAAQGGAWYRQPVLWLGAAILFASLAGCVWMVMLGQRYADVSLEGVQPHSLLDMPVHAVAGPDLSRIPDRRQHTDAARAGNLHLPARLPERKR